MNVKEWCVNNCKVYTENGIWLNLLLILGKVLKLHDDKARKMWSGALKNKIMCIN